MRNEIDNIYKDLCDVIISETDLRIPCFDTSKKQESFIKHINHSGMKK